MLPSISIQSLCRRPQHIMWSQLKMENRIYVADKREQEEKAELCHHIQDEKQKMNNRTVMLQSRLHCITLPSFQRDHYDDIVRSLNTKY